MMKQILQHPVVRTRRLRAAWQRLQPASMAQESVRAQERDPQHPSTAGQALVEFALVLMFVILPFTFVLIDGAVTLYIQAAVANVTREGAHAGSIYQCGSSTITCVLAVNQTFADQVATIDTARTQYVQQEIQQAIGPLVQCSMSPIAYNPETAVVGNPYRELDSMTVEVACPRQLFFGLVGTGQITLTSQATMRIEPGGVALPPIP